MDNTETCYEVWEEDADNDIISAGYKFVSAGHWYAEGTEAVLLFNITGSTNLEQYNEEASNNLLSLENYIKSGDPNYSGLFGGWCDPAHSSCSDNVNYREGWDEEGCSYNEFNIYKNGVLVRKATKEYSAYESNISN